MYVVGEQVKINGIGFGIIEVINKKTVEVWCDKGRGIVVNKKYVKEIKK
jgi:hypothetical protein